MRASCSATGRAGKDSRANRLDVGADTETEPATDLEEVRVDCSGRSWTPGTPECAGNIDDAVHQASNIALRARACTAPARLTPYAESAI